VKRSKPPARRTPVRRVNKKRAAKKFVRNFDSPEYVEHIRSLPCASCGSVGWSVAAHVIPRGMGGANGKASDLVPLCDPNGRLAWWPSTSPGCHWLYDNRETYPDTRERLAVIAKRLWAEWRHIQDTEGTEND
jgi:hypothetical protein